MELAVDIGNTFIKAGIFQNDRLFEILKLKSLNYQRLLSFAFSHSVKDIIISSVRKEHPFNNSRFRKFFRHIIELDAQTKLPITNLYKTPETLGKDRLAGVIGAQTIFPENNVLVIDMGSAITFDFINDKNEYYGGNISPGLSMRYKALHDFTSRLPKLIPANKTELLGKTTVEAIHSGVQNGIIFEIEKYIETLKKQHTGLKIILTGGDSNFFDNKLNYTIFVESNLILKGLQRILKYNIYEI
jgi:type III pantothenate kinase